MNGNKTSLERAFDLAISGTCLYLTDIIQHLKSEGYSIDQLEGASVRKQLVGLIEKAKKTHA
jgi:hypothetical protein